MRRITHSVYLAIICIQFGIIAAFVVHFGREETRFAVMREELTDWEQVAAMWKQHAMSYALAHDGCTRVIRTYQRSIFQPVEMNK